MKKCLPFLFFLEVSALASAPINPVLSSYWFSPTTHTALNKIAEQFEITKKINGGFEVLVPLSESKTLLDLAPQAQLIEFDISKTLKERSRKDVIGYHNFETVQTHLKSLVEKHPELATLENYGTSLEKRPLLALRVSSPDKSSQKPAILLTSSTHGDELITVEVLFGLMDKLLSGYEKDSRLNRILNSYEIYFVPVVNPDGYIRTERYANGVDPNRDFPWQQDPEHKSNPCVAAIIKFYETHRIKASIDFHASGEMIMYPWAYTYDSLPSYEENIFDSITAQMASFNGYQHGQISKVIYVARGSSADYYHWKHQAWSLGIEVGTSKIPATSQIPTILQQNTESTWTFIESIK